MSSCLLKNTSHLLPITKTKMSSVCADNRYHHHHHHHPLFSQDHLIIPPRRLFNTQQTKLLISTSGHKRPQQEQQSYINVDDEEGIDDDGGCGGVDDVDDDDEEADGPFATDEFRMYEFKVRRCMRSRSHDWTDCPFAHPGEKARRRDPRRFHYSGDACADFRRGSCARGDSCEFAHGVFECWLHPARYRTHACKDGKSCKRKVCFFAHSPRELRVLPSSSSSSKQCCCRGFCRNNSSRSRSISSTSNNPCYDNHSPTSTLMGISHLMPSSPTMSPPSSPSDATASLLSVKSRVVINGRKSGDFTKSMSYKSAVLELARSLKAMEISGNNINNIACSNGDYAHQLSWSDHHHHHHQDQEQFVLSPYCTTPPKGNSLINYYVASSPESRSANIFNEDSNSTGGQVPDLEWVNELVM